MLVNVERDVIGELVGLRTGSSYAALPDRVDGAVAKGKSRKGFPGWMQGEVYSIV
jgi:hypothetical protein